MSEIIIQLNGEVVKNESKELMRNSVEETLQQIAIAIFRNLKIKTNSRM